MTDPYFSVPAISATALKAGATSMRHMAYAMTGGEKADTPSLRFGRLVHLCALEPATARNSFVVFDGVRRGKAWEQFDAEHADKEIITPDEAAQLAAITEAVRSNPHAAKLLEGVKTEVPIYWRTDTAGDCKAKLDAIGPDYMVEIKTTRSIAALAFERSCYQLGYHLQLGWYAEAMAAKRRPRSASYVIAIENVAPFDVVVYQADEQLIEQGREQALRLAQQYRQCEAAGVFPGVGNGEVRVLSLPPYAVPDLELV